MNRIDRDLTKMARECEQRSVPKYLYDKVYDELQRTKGEVTAALWRIVDAEHSEDIANQGYVK